MAILASISIISALAAAVVAYLAGCARKSELSAVELTGMMDVAWQQGYTKAQREALDLMAVCYATGEQAALTSAGSTPLDPADFEATGVWDCAGVTKVYGDPTMVDVAPIGETTKVDSPKALAARAGWDHGVAAVASAVRRPVAPIVNVATGETTGCYVDLRPATREALADSLVDDLTGGGIIPRCIAADTARWLTERD